MNKIENDKVGWLYTPLEVLAQQITSNLRYTQ